MLTSVCWWEKLSCERKDLCFSQAEYDADYMWNILILCRIISLWALLSELVMVWLFGLVNCFILVVSSLCVMTCFTFLSVSRLFWLSYSSISRPSFVDLSPFPLFQSVFVSFVMKACLFFFSQPAFVCLVFSDCNSDLIWFLLFWCHEQKPPNRHWFARDQRDTVAIFKHVLLLQNYGLFCCLVMNKILSQAW